MPLSVIKYENIIDNLNLNFDLGEIAYWQIVCPNPVVADSFRFNLAKGSNSSRFESTTIAKFLGDLFLKCFGEKKVSRKSELLKILGTVWKLKFEGEDTSYFHQSFELFTDLRSFTLDKSLMDIVLENYHPVVAESVKTFWLVLENQQIIDEHQAYHDLYHHCLENPEVLSEEELSGFIFSGFSHLSANQIEFIKLLGKFTEVIIPIPSEVVQNSLPTDWVDWVLTQTDKVIEKVGGKERRPVPAKLFSKGRVNTLLKNIESDKFENILFPKKSLSFSEALKSYSKGYFFKSQSEDVSSYVEILKNELMHKFLLSQSEKVNVDDLRSYLLERVQGKKFNTLKAFSEFKVITSLVSAIEDYEELSDSNNHLGEFDFSILWEVLQLNLPRNFYLPLLKDVDGQLISLKELYQVSPMDRNLLVVSSDHDLKVGGVGNYPKDVQEILVTLGPIRRQGLDFLFYIFHLRELLSFSSTSILLEEGVLEHDQAWANVFKGITIEKERVTPVVTNEVPSEPKEPEARYSPPEKLSASRMQLVLECPKKYYYNYVLGLGKEPDKVNSVDPRHLGEAEHEVVQDYLEVKDDWDEKFFLELVMTKVSKFFKKELLENKLLEEEIFSEVTSFGRQTIIEFLKLKKIDPQINFKFEQKINNDEGTGAADVVIDSSVFGKMLFDLKRSSGSIPDKYKILSLKTIQIWYYQFFLGGKESPFDCFGYINLSDPEGSIVFVSNKELKQQLIDLNFFELNQYELMREEYQYYMDGFYGKFKDCQELVKEHINYPVNPIDSGACTFCPGANICTRGVEL